MINKRSFLKALSAIALGTLTVGNFSNVWMMDEPESVIDNNERQKNCKGSC